MFEVGFDCYGVPMGTDKFVTSELMVLAREIAADAKKTRELLTPNKQALWATLRLSTAQRFQFLCQHVHPSLCEPVAEWLDTQLWRELEETVGFDIPPEQNANLQAVAVLVALRERKDNFSPLPFLPSLVYMGSRQRPRIRVNSRLGILPRNRFSGPVSFWPRNLFLSTI